MTATFDIAQLRGDFLTCFRDFGSSNYKKGLYVRDCQIYTMDRDQLPEIIRRGLLYLNRYVRNYHVEHKDVNNLEKAIEAVQTYRAPETTINEVTQYSEKPIIGIYKDEEKVLDVTFKSGVVLQVYPKAILKCHSFEE